MAEAIYLSFHWNENGQSAILFKLVCVSVQSYSMEHIRETLDFIVFSKAILFRMIPFCALCKSGLYFPALLPILLFNFWGSLYRFVCPQLTWISFALP